MQKRIKLLFILLTVSGLAGCATFSAPKYQTLSRKMRYRQLSEITHWKVRGSFALRGSGQFIRASFYWHQIDRNHYTLSIFGPLGMDAVNIERQPNQFTLKTAKGEIYKARTAEQLMQKQLGWHLPIANLHYWIRGLPAPQGKKGTQFDRYNHLVSLTQQGFSVHLMQYQAIPAANGFSTILPAVKFWTRSGDDERRSRSMTNEKASRRNVYQIHEDGEQRRQLRCKFIREGYTVDLPKKLFIQGQQIRLQLDISSWQL